MSVPIRRPKPIKDVRFGTVTANEHVPAPASPGAVGNDDGRPKGLRDQQARVWTDGNEGVAPKAEHVGRERAADRILKVEPEREANAGEPAASERRNHPCSARVPHPVTHVAFQHPGPNARGVWVTSQRDTTVPPRQEHFRCRADNRSPGRSIVVGLHDLEAGNRGLPIPRTSCCRRPRPPRTD